MQEQFIRDVTAVVQADDRIRAAWLAGSFGRGDADRYADVDLHLLLAEADVAAFRAGAEEWLNQLRPLVLFKSLFGGSVLNALTAEGLRVDLVIHGHEPPMSLDRTRARVIYDSGVLTLDGSTMPPDPQMVAQRLAGQIKEFWRCIAMLPVVIGRRESIVAVQGLGVEIALLTDVLVDGYRVPRETGIKKLNRYLPGDTQRRLEAALAWKGLTPAGLAQAHLDLARIMQEHGPMIAADHGFPYPQRLETAALAYVQRELTTLDLSVAIDDLVSAEMRSDGDMVTNRSEQSQQ